MHPWSWGRGRVRVRVRFWVWDGMGTGLGGWLCTLGGAWMGGQGTCLVKAMVSAIKKRGQAPITSDTCAVRICFVWADGAHDFSESDFGTAVCRDGMIWYSAKGVCAGNSLV